MLDTRHTRSSKVQVIMSCSRPNPAHSDGESVRDCLRQLCVCTRLRPRRPFQVGERLNVTGSDISSSCKQRVPILANTPQPKQDGKYHFQGIG
jgi:hypothetical protein